METLVDYDVPGLGEYYLVPKQTGREILTSPYLYTIDGKDVPMTSVSVPIKNNGRFVGIITRDMEMNVIQQQLERIKPYEGTIVALYSNDGVIAGHFDSERIGKAMTDTEQDLAGSHLSALVQAVQ